MRIAIINYPTSLQSAVFGLNEMFSLANRLCLQNNVSRQFDVDTLLVSQLADPSWDDSN
jgi:hypothetical protein